MRILRNLARRRLRTALTSARSAEVLALLRTLNHSEGHTFLIVTHDPEVGAACDRTIRMRDGCIVSDGHDAMPAVAR